MGIFPTEVMSGQLSHHSLVIAKAHLGQGAPSLLDGTCRFPATTQERLVQQQVGLGSHDEIDPAISSQPGHLVQMAALEDWANETTSWGRLIM